MVHEKSVKTAIIPAAGLASRIFPFTKHINKLMLPILNKPVIHYLIDELENSGIEKIIITGRNLGVVKDYFKYNHRLKLLTVKHRSKASVARLDVAKTKCKIIFLTSDKPRGWAHELYLARKYLQRGPFVVMFSDMVCHPETQTLKYLIDKFDRTGLNIKSNGRFVFRSDVLHVLEKIRFKDGDPENKSITKFMKHVNERGATSCYIKNDPIFDTGNSLDFLRAITFSSFFNFSLSLVISYILRIVLITEFISTTIVQKIIEASNENE